MKKIATLYVLASVALFAADGKAIYDANCKSCHGADGKMKALGKSAPLTGSNAAAVEKDLAEYKAGTLNKYGSGAVMKPQAAKLSADDTKAVASYIATLK